MRKFSSDSATFKSHPRDMDRLKSEERINTFQRSMHNLLQAKKDAGERQNARRLERLIVQFKSNQLEDEDTKDQISVI